MQKLTEHNQGYWDRLQRAESWIQRGQEIEDWEDHGGPFIFYWIALNSLYGRHKMTRRSEENDLGWFLNRICHLDSGERSLMATLQPLKSKVDRILKDQFLLELYWQGAGSSKVKQILNDDYDQAQDAWRAGKLDKYLALLFGRLRVLRNQIFHGCSTDRKSLNKTSLLPALNLLETLVSLFVGIMRKHGEVMDWPGVPYPRKGSPQHPK